MKSICLHITTQQRVRIHRDETAQKNSKLDLFDSAKKRPAIVFGAGNCAHVSSQIACTQQPVEVNL